MEKKYDYIIVGAGFYGAICAHELHKLGYEVLVLEKRDHIGGNCYTSKRNGINVHDYGPHIFHTSNETVWKWINQFAEFNNFTLQTVAQYRGKMYSLPFNMWTFNQLWNINRPSEAMEIIKQQGSYITWKPRNLEEQAIKLVGTDVYEKLIKGYTEKQWMKPASELPPEIIKRLPVRFTYNNNYFNDKYQGIPIGGYTQIFEKLLDGIEVKLGVDFLEDREHWENMCIKNVIYTGPIDAYFNYEFGHLEYKTTRFDHQLFQHVENWQGAPVVNYTDADVPVTRVIEHKHFENSNSDHTWITYEYPTKYIPGKTEPYYPVNDELNNGLYQKYCIKANQLTTKTHFGGRLAEYKYYDMHKVIESALKMVDELTWPKTF